MPSGWPAWPRLLGPGRAGALRRGALLRLRWFGELSPSSPVECFVFVYLPRRMLSRASPPQQLRRNTSVVSTGVFHHAVCTLALRQKKPATQSASCPASCSCRRRSYFYFSLGRRGGSRRPVSRHTPDHAGGRPSWPRRFRLTGSSVRRARR